jgi:O-antigen/teichoic acid export membrane protein
MQRQIIGGAMAFNIDAPTLEQIVIIVLAIVALVAAVAWLSHRRRQRSRTRWITDKYKQMARLFDFGLPV